MKRDPSIHVRRSSLTKALDIILQDRDILELTPEDVVACLFHSLKGEAIRNRVVIQANALTKKKMERVASVDKQIAEQFHAAYQQVNLQNNIKTTTIKATDGKYITLKEVAQHAKEFCDMFSLEYEHGFQVYITIGIRLAKSNYSIYKLKALGDRIIKEYEDVLAISEDDEKEGTAAFYSAWRAINIKHFGNTPSITEPRLFSHFLVARKAADKHKADYHDWVDAQFERWAALDSSPELSQLYGDNAELAYTKYMGLKKKEYGSTEEKEYFEKGKSKLKPSSAKEAAVKRKYKVVCDQIDEEMLEEHGYIYCTSCGVRHNGLLGHAHSHNLPKGEYKKYEIEKWNISIRCLDCHRSLDNYVFDDIQYFKDLEDIMYWRETFEPLAYNRFVTGLNEVGCDKYDYVEPDKK